MSELKDFFGASVGAAAALIGLLFVAITLAPEAIFGAGAEARLRGRAVGAFNAFGNVFFVSLAALLPTRAAPTATAVVAFLSLCQCLNNALQMRRLFPELRDWRNFGAISAAIFAVELLVAIRLRFGAAQPLTLAYILLGLYAYALGSSWELLGAHRSRK